MAAVAFASLPPSLPVHPFLPLRLRCPVCGVYSAPAVVVATVVAVATPAAAAAAATAAASAAAAAAPRWCGGKPTGAGAANRAQGLGGISDDIAAKPRRFVTVQHPWVLAAFASRRCPRVAGLAAAEPANSDEDSTSTW